MPVFILTGAVALFRIRYQVQQYHTTMQPAVGKVRAGNSVVQCIAQTTCSSNSMRAHAPPHGTPLES